MDNKKKKIGYIVSLFPCWSETFILNEIIELNKQGFDVSIFSIRNDFEEYTQEKAKPFLSQTYYALKIKVLCSVLKWMILKPAVLLPWLLHVNFQKYRGVKLWLKNVYSVFVGCAFASVVKKEGIDHLHAHFATYPTLVAMTITKLTGVDYTFTAHAHDIFLDKTLLCEKVQEAKAVVTISEYNKKYISDLCGEQVLDKIHVIHCGLDMKEWDFTPKAQEHKKYRIVCVGRLTEMKGFDYLVRACSLLKGRIDFHLTVVGDGHLRKPMEDLIDELGLKENVSLEGVLGSANVRDLIERADVFAVPSIWNDSDGQDGIPLVLMEALAMGTPSVATRISGIPELVEDQVTGLLADPKNEGQLADNIITLCTDEDLRNRVIQKGRRRVEEEFNIVINAELLTKVFQAN